MYILKLGKDNKVDGTIPPSEFEKVVNTIQPLKEYEQGHIERELIKENEKGDKIRVYLEDGSAIEMVYIKYVTYRDEGTELMCFVGENMELNIFFCFNSEEVYGGLSPIQEGDDDFTEEMEFIKILNFEWQEFIEENKLKILMDSGDENVEYILKNVIFKNALFERTIDGYYGESYVIDMYNLTFSLNGKTETMGAAPNFNHYSENTWFLSPDLEYLDTSEGKIRIYNKKEFVSEFKITTTQEKFLQQILFDFNLVDKCETEYEKRKEKYLTQEAAKIKGFLSESLDVETNFAHNGMNVEIINTTTGETVDCYTRFTLMIEF